jgi:plant G-box-binding factor
MQAETEELAHKVESLNAENVAIKSELERLTETLMVYIHVPPL